MIGLIVIYFVGTSFYKLAEEFRRSKWGYVILGIACYYGSGVIAGVFLALVTPDIIEEMGSTSEFIMNLSAIPLGLASCWGVRAVLRSSWSKPLTSDATILDADLTN